MAWMGKTKVDLLKGDLKLTMAFYGCSGRPDLDNLVKLWLDAANHILWNDDRQIVQIDAKKIRHDDKPRTEVTIEML